MRKSMNVNDIFMEKTFKKTNRKIKTNYAWTAGFEPARAKPTWFLVMPDNHSGTSTCCLIAGLLYIIVEFFSLQNSSYTIKRH